MSVIKKQVLAAQDELSAATSHTELRKWAMENGINSASGFSSFKKALLEIGIDYEAMRQAEFSQKADELAAAITHEITLHTDAKASHSRFAICDAEGEPLWHGRFFEGDRDFNGEQSSGELAAAKKAVWLASKIMEAVGAKAARLTLKVDAQWLCYQDHAKQKGYVLTQLCRKFNLELKVEWIPGSENPADKWTVANGYKKWQDNNLNDLATPIK